MNFQLLLEDMAEKGWDQATLIRTAKARGIALNANRVDRFMRGTYRTPQTWKLIATALGRPLSRYVVRSAA